MKNLDVRDFYYNYTSTTDNPVSEREYSAILKEYGTVLREIALETGSVVIKKLGLHIDLVKVISSKKSMDHRRSIDLGQKVYHMNYHTDGFTCKIEGYVNLVKHYKQRRDYVFRKHTKLKHGFRDRLRSKAHIYPIKIGKRI